SPMPGATHRLKLWIAYDGRPFRGWQSQASGDAVQDVFEKALATVAGHPITLHGCSRTDAGVHALGQVAHADVPAGKHDTGTWQAALNAYLPAEIRVLRIGRASPAFHARFSARRKTYIYRIWNGPFLHPLEIGRAWHVPLPLDDLLLRTGAALLEGTHDFAGFAANRRKPIADAVRTIQPICIGRRGAVLTLRFEADGFLYKMVRLLTGTLVRCGQGRASVDLIPKLLEGGGAIKTPHSAPPEGLYLARVVYGRKR
ncbi:MAG: tRNA pseudouridine(38-40) synthase TruA, partial [Verrucomicrobiota bacterium]|nr:tRNA pseudouridine(38-40) synthase TruA [Verrucomicrobiota bacterium]